MKKITRAVAPIIVSIVIAFVPAPDGLAQHAWYFFAIFIGIVLGLILECLPGPEMGLIGVAITAALAPWTLFGPNEISASGFNAPSRAIEWALSALATVRSG